MQNIYLSFPLFFSPPPFIRVEIVFAIRVKKKKIKKKSAMGLLYYPITSIFMHYKKNTFPPFLTLAISQP